MRQIQKFLKIKTEIKILEGYTFLILLLSMGDLHVITPQTAKFKIIQNKFKKIKRSKQ